MKNSIIPFLVSILLFFTTSLFAHDFEIKLQNSNRDSTILAKPKKEKSNKMSSSIDGASDKGNFVMQATLNFGHHSGFKKIYSGYGYDYTYTGLIPGVTLNLDYNVHKYVSVGVYYSVAFQKFTKSNVFYLANVVGARSSFHWWQYLADKSGKELLPDKIDFDVHIHVGGFLISEKNKTTGEKIKHAGPNAGGGLGFKYYFVKNFGVALDAGYEESSWLKIGIVFKV